MPAMVMERMPEGPPATASVPGDKDAARRALRAQLLATEHWSLLATRSLSWNESFSRSSMFLSLLSGAVVALALVAQATAFGSGFAVFAVLLLPVVLFVGIATFVRLVEINNEDLVWVRGMNRLRRAYLELDPELEKWFVTGIDEEPAGIMLTYGTDPQKTHLLHGLVTTPATIGFVNAMLAAVLASIALVQLKMAVAPVAGVGVLVFIATVAILGRYSYRATIMVDHATALQEARRKAKGQG
jgi:hypothetical protein